MLDEDPSKRPTVENLLKDPSWFATEDTINAESLNVYKKLTAADCMKLYSKSESPKMEKSSPEMSKLES